MNKEIMKSISPSMKKYILAGIALVAVFFVFAAQSAAPVNAKMFYIGDQAIGPVESESVVEKVTENVKDELSIRGLYEAEYSSEFSFDSIQVKREELLSENEIRESVKANLDCSLYGYEIRIEQSSFAVLRTLEDAQQTLNLIKAEYAGAENTQNAEFVESVSIVRVPVEMPNIEGVQTALDKFKNGSGERETYVVQSGDTTWDIALRYGLSLEALAEENKDKDLTRIREGDAINLSTPKAWMHVKTTKTVEEERPVIAGTVYEKTPDMYVGEQKVKSLGEDGLKKVILEQTYINGTLDSEVTVSEVVVTAPVETVILSGSKWREVASTGNFSNPAEGTLTSRFGSRWGRKHEGIDIGAPIGTPIKAADAGVVIASRFISGYGYSIIIDHGNGVNTLYGHASALLAEVGQTVEKNDVIARVGTSGSTTGSCLHFEVRVNGQPVDPLPYVNYE